MTACETLRSFAWCNTRRLSLAALAATLTGLGLSEIWGLTLNVGTRTRGGRVILAKSTLSIVFWGTGPMSPRWTLRALPSTQHRDDRRWWFAFRSAAGPFELCVPLWIAPLPPAAWCVLARRPRVPEGPACRVCGCSLAGVGDSACPECGTPQPRDEADTESPDRSG